MSKELKVSKYFYAQNAGRPYAGQRFHIYELVGGTACGVFTTEDAKLEEELSKLAADPKSPVQEITKPEFDAAIKKNPPQFNNWIPSAVSSSSLIRPQDQAIQGTGAVVVSASSEVKTEAQEPPVEIVSQVATTEDALKLGTVAPAEGSTPDPTADKPKDASRTWDKKNKKK